MTRRAWKLNLVKTASVLVLMRTRNRNGFNRSVSSKTFADIKSLTQESRSNNSLQFWSERHEEGRIYYFYAQAGFF